MRQTIFYSTLSLTALILVIGISSCCLNCANPPKGGGPAYSASTPDSASTTPPSGEIIGDVRVIKMTAQKYRFAPSTIAVNQGDNVRLEITSKDATHGFALKEYNIDRKLEPGKTEFIEFTADKAGTFNFHCSVFCGMGHLGMKGKLIVQQK